VYFEVENRTWRQHFFTNALRKNSCIGKKWWNDVQKFTPTNIFRGLEFPGDFPHGCMSRRNTVCHTMLAYVGVPKIWGRWCSASWSCGTMFDGKKRAYYQMSHCVKFGHSGLNGLGLWTIPKIWEHWVKRYDHTSANSVPPFNVIQGHRNWPGSIGYLLTTSY